MSDPVENDPEIEILSREDAKIRAEDYRGSRDPYPDIAPSLLSAEHIKQYVEKTGLIGPFYSGGGDKSRLKKASYEGRIGEFAYTFNENKEIVKVPFVERCLVVPKNSIMFTECDLDFRLPDFIALRFNLQIRHVHRGLLLGTGPLVDPGYWGKLCIPLHNLTNEDYSIPLEEGLIWVEFTKTTWILETNVGRGPLGESGHWEIQKFLQKSSQPYDKNKPRIGINSSLPDIVQRVEKHKEETKESVKKMEKTVEEMEKTMDSMKEYVLGLGVPAFVFAFFGLVFFLYNFIQATYEQVDETRKHVEEKLEVQGSKMIELKTYNETLERRVQFLEAENASSHSPLRGE